MDKVNYGKQTQCRMKSGIREILNVFFHRLGLSNVDLEDVVGFM